MATKPTPEQAAKYILQIMVKKFNVRGGQILMRNSLITPFSTDGWQSSDETAGLQYAVQKGWVTVKENIITLTDDGYAAA
jgi:hypothetical protein